MPSSSFTKSAERTKFIRFGSRDEDGKFTFKNGGRTTSTSHMSREEIANTLFANTRDQEEEKRKKERRKNELLNILGDKATSADILYGTPEELEKKINEIGLRKKGISTGGASTVNNTNSRKWERPVSGIITSKFDLHRMHPTKHIVRPHYGVDFRAPIGTPVKSIADGKVIKAGAASGYGIAVYVDHGMINGKHVVSEYGHLSKCDVKVGDIIKAGQVVAKSGNSGESQAPHLHLTIKENGKAVNPINYLRLN